MEACGAAIIQPTSHRCRNVLSVPLPVSAKVGWRPMPEASMMPAEVMAAEIVDLLHNGSNGEIRVKISTERPAFVAPITDLT